MFEVSSLPWMVRRTIPVAAGAGGGSGYRLGGWLMSPTLAR
jgi:hypothetical protein